ncbi:MAG: DNA topoisomerase IB [Anaerolineae bacterium]|nr:DNA topoisomerase IB [Anaerolineae bacterium]
MVKTRKPLTPKAAARSAALRYVNDDEPGISRSRSGRGFVYRDADGERIRDREMLERIKALVIPPAWTDVWICADADGHIQATGYDAKGRKQYRYHERWRAARDRTKFDRMIAFGEALPTTRQRVQADLARPGLPREKVLAAVVQIMGATFIRVGNAEYERQNRSYGLTTLHDKHVDIAGSTVHFEFQGKSGKEQAIDLKDRRLAQIIKRSQDVPGQHLFQYYDDDGSHHAITSSDVNDYIRQISGADFTAKDFRTWGGTTLALLALEDFDPCDDEAQALKNVTAMIKQVANQLGNTPAVCRKYYIHPAVIDCYLRGDLAQYLLKHSAKGDLNPEEAAVLRLLKAS